ncbi:SDR family oxidoreductase [Paenibacillus sp. N3/727]|uniref:SDR family oxidoreductase n=1 Tax=Paenibacillus sp. N3/727 TaxID=2925845 RepID=UPI001F52D591|nr:SDR family oxidoreductase [Paenibacillus sp. N3/727]UNK18271.1 SDR family oxidoreductase [Paenibacillus sp. N3/727]
MKALKGKIAIVTGASRRIGIGSAICQALAEAGADIFFTYWRPYDRTMEWGEDHDWPQLLVKQLEQEGVRAYGMEADLSHPATPKQIIEEVSAVFGQPSILVNNAAYSTLDGYENLSADILDAHYAVNVRGTCMLCAEFAKAFQLPSGGRIINMTSGQDKGPMPGELAYVASKGAISAFTVSLAAELAPLQITVNAVDPGPTDSGWMSEGLKSFLLPRFPMKRIGQPSDAARLVKLLASDEAGWITGQIIHSDGGFM